MPEAAPLVSASDFSELPTIPADETASVKTLNVRFTGIVAGEAPPTPDHSTIEVELPRPGELAPALLFGRYRPLRQLGRGGMGVVWLAQDEVLRIPIALKMVPEELAMHEDHLEGLRKEVLRGIALTHPGIVRIFSFERAGSQAAITMEYVEGESLAELQARQPNRCFDPETLRLWLEQMCATLDYAHAEARIAHRDLKPRNLMVTREGRLKITDFGIASSLNEELNGVSVRNDSSGTPPYMSPQQAMGERPTIADDIYSLGATLYDLITGRPPFYRGNIIAQVLQEEAAPMSERRTELGVTDRLPISAQWERMVAACLSKDPSLRPPNGAALLQLLNTSPHAMIPYIPRPPIPLDSLKLDVRTDEKPAQVIEAEIVRLPGAYQQARQQVQVLKPENGLVTFFCALGEDLLDWGKKIAAVLLFIGALVAALTIYNRLEEKRAREEALEMQQRIIVQVPQFQPQPQQIEVRYIQQPPPQNWPPPPPPPPRMGPPGRPMGPPPR